MRLVTSPFHAPRCRCLLLLIGYQAITFGLSPSTSAACVATSSAGDLAGAAHLRPASLRALHVSPLGTCRLLQARVPPAIQIADITGPLG